jgi:hypothetical protein
MKETMSPICGVGWPKSVMAVMAINRVTMQPAPVATGSKVRAILLPVVRIGRFHGSGKGGIAREHFEIVN